MWVVGCCWGVGDGLAAGVGGACAASLFSSVELNWRKVSRGFSVFWAGWAGCRRLRSLRGCSRSCRCRTRSNSTPTHKNARTYKRSHTRARTHTHTHAHTRTHAHTHTHTLKHTLTLSLTRPLYVRAAAVSRLQEHGPGRGGGAGGSGRKQGPTPPSGGRVPPPVVGRLRE